MRRLLVGLVLGAVLVVAALPTPIASAQGVPDQTIDCDAERIFAMPVRHAGLMDWVIGNRSRMIQFTFVGFALGLAILMTSARKH